MFEAKRVAIANGRAYYRPLKAVKGRNFREVFGPGIEVAIDLAGEGGFELSRDRRAFVVSLDPDVGSWATRLSIAAPPKRGTLQGIDRLLREGQEPLEALFALGFTEVTYDGKSLSASLRPFRERTDEPPRFAGEAAELLHALGPKISAAWSGADREARSYRRARGFFSSLTAWKIATSEAGFAVALLLIALGKIPREELARSFVPSSVAAAAAVAVALVSVRIWGRRYHLRKPLYYRWLVTGGVLAGAVGYGLALLAHHLMLV